MAFDGSICNDFGGWKEVVECFALIYFSINLSFCFSFFFNFCCLFYMYFE